MKVHRNTRTFTVYRKEDETGISGTGEVAEGIEFSDGTVAVHWLSHTASTGIYGNMKQFNTLHGHDGKTHIAWDDERNGVEHEEEAKEESGAEASDREIEND